MKQKNSPCQYLQLSGSQQKLNNYDRQRQQLDQVKEQLISGYPKTIDYYRTGKEFYCLSIAKKDDLPQITIETEENLLCLPLQQYKKQTSNQMSIPIGQSNLFFVLEIFSTPDPILYKYKSPKLQGQERIRMYECVTDLIRHQKEFMNKIERDQEVQLFQSLTFLQSSLTQQLESKISEVKPVNFSFKSLLIIFILFFLIGLMIEHNTNQEVIKSRNKSLKTKFESAKSKNTEKQKKPKKKKKKKQQ